MGARASFENPLTFVDAYAERMVMSYWNEGTRTAKYEMLWLSKVDQMESSGIVEYEVCRSAD